MHSSMRPPLLLASASPRRAELLRAAGIPFDVRPADVDEGGQPGEPPEDYVRRVSEAKARAVAPFAAGRSVVSADTVVVVDDEILGKPLDPGAAVRMLARLSGRTHIVFTGVCLGVPPAAPDGGAWDEPDTLSGGGWRYLVDVCATTVEFAQLSRREIESYVATGEPLDKAGAYAIQGLASRFVVRIEGSYTNVVGLPVELVVRLCKGAGILIS
jgi:septum formation protein